MVEKRVDKNLFYLSLINFIQNRHKTDSGHIYCG